MERMMKTKYVTIIITLLNIVFSVSSIATIINVPGDQPTIQAGIDATTDGDTVLVAPNTYYENINFNGKHIVVASYFVLNQNRTFITSTIINGSTPSNTDTVSCVVINSGEDSTAILQGFTVTGGKGTKWVDPNLPSYTWRGGGGVLTFMSSPTIKNNLIINNEVINTNGVNGAQGGGILCYGGNPKIINNVITLNNARYGAGIVIDYSGGIIKNNIIYKNSGGQDYGGGGFWSIGNGSSPIILENNHIVENSVTGSGSYGGRGGAMFVWMGTVTVRNNIIWGNTQSQGDPIAEIDGGNAEITYSNVEGGFSGTGNINLIPAFLDSSLYLSELSSCIDAGNPFPDFNDKEDPNNSGFALFPSLGELKNDMGAYGGPDAELLPEFEYFLQNLLNNPESAVFDSQNNRYLVSNYGDGNIIQFDSLGQQTYFNQDCNSLAGMHIVGDTLFALDYQGENPGLVGLSLSTGDTLFTLHIAGMDYLNDITSDTSGNLYITDTYANKIFKVKISDMSYTTFVDSGLDSPDGILFDEANNMLLVINSVMSTNGPIEAVRLEDSTMTTFIRTGIKGLDGITRDNYGYTYISSWHTDKVYRYDENFTNPPEEIAGGYTAPGDIYFNKQDNVLVVPDFFTHSVDFIPITYTEVGEVEYPPNDFRLMQNYPNPFNPSTKINYSIPQSSFVSLIVYDVLGNEVATLVREEKQPGEYKAKLYGNELTSGIYFYQLKAGNYIAAKKMVLLK